MPSKKKPAAALPAIARELNDQFVKGPVSAEAVQEKVLSIRETNGLHMTVCTRASARQRGT